MTNIIFLSHIFPQKGRNRYFKYNDIYHFGFNAFSEFWVSLSVPTEMPQAYPGLLKNFSHQPVTVHHVLE